MQNNIGNYIEYQSIKNMTVEKLRYRLNFYKMYGGNVTIT